ncbi:MAG: HU family DNA-binding protein [Deltaproteobacteria bacterium]|jgi:nucleoid DNA-binding protein|nr:HU family DNA-binding protein [Deltaproteobacteria bacterium]
MDKEEFIDKVATKSGLSIEKVNSYFAAVSELLGDRLKARKHTNIWDFGVIYPVVKEMFNGKNPKTLEPFTINAHIAIHFKLNKSFMIRVNSLRFGGKGGQE